LLDSPLEPVVQRFYLLEGNNCKCVEACHVVADVKLRFISTAVSLVIRRKHSPALPVLPTIRRSMQ
jgi:hypothetical protein